MGGWWLERNGRMEEMHRCVILCELRVLIPPRVSPMVCKFHQLLVVLCWCFLGAVTTGDSVGKVSVIWERREGERSGAKSEHDAWSLKWLFPYLVGFPRLFFVKLSSLDTLSFIHPLS